MLGWPMSVLGLFGCLVAVVAKIAMERAAARELEHCDSQLQLLKSQIQEGEKEREDLDAELPRGGGASDRDWLPPRRTWPVWKNCCRWRPICRPLVNAC